MSLACSSVHQKYLISQIVRRFCYLIACYTAFFVNRWLLGRTAHSTGTLILNAMAILYLEIWQEIGNRLHKIQIITIIACLVSWTVYLLNAYIVFPHFRKRSREEDACEFMPLSKRINNLHINNNLRSPIPQPSDSSQNNAIATENGISSPSPLSDSERRPSYDPGINSSDSRYYYENKLLFELHLERIQRSGQQFPF